ncbi:ABC transporter permease [Bacillus sp. DTU_2020_1000418_1_SI_GHA_SEK_038]|uniref:ABC transporter permease n=1 Tax=Bacillus sp. DTU_2020_1000418_1_SI_GHA_SEK_038 TaxID=3077585 RepID=UPI0028E1EF6F|nr:ABC transporter permease [Bacillus sp. DTU_2020_1000418_1_SI_GHA_SEK_038]WNS76575.1 ABC transporter permease [Bacillus sp. DTU_2020_1000418_1_SI_GHA_SEK_038]
MIEVKTETWVPDKQVSFSRRLARISGLQWLLLIIPLAYILILMFFSMIDFFKLSFFNADGFTLEYIKSFFSTPVYLKVLWLTLKISLLVTVFALVIAYPLAYSLVITKSALWKRIIFSAVLIPFWISLLVRTFAWTILLRKNGVINIILMKLGIIDQPLELIYNTTGVVIAMTHILLPYMVLSLYSVMAGIDQRLLQAAQGMGARPMKAFFQVFFPLSVPGLLSGSLLVFVMGIGYFITPALLGGPNTIMISMLIESNINTTLNWHLASVLALVLFVATILLLLIALLVTGKNPVLKELE